MPPPRRRAELPDRVLLLTVAVPPTPVVDAAALVDGGVSGQGAAADRRRADVVDAAAVVAGGVAGQGAALTVSVAVGVEMPPPIDAAELPDRVLPLIVAFRRC